MTYSVEIVHSAQRQLAKIDRQDQPRIFSAIRELASDPRPPACKKMTGRPAWRIRVGPYRIIYEIQDQQLRILVIAVGHRRDIYK